MKKGEGRPTRTFPLAVSTDPRDRDAKGRYRFASVTLSCGLPMIKQGCVLASVALWLLPVGPAWADCDLFKDALKRQERALEDAAKSPEKLAIHRVVSGLTCSLQREQSRLSIGCTAHDAQYDPINQLFDRLRSYVSSCVHQQPLLNLMRANKIRSNIGSSEIYSQFSNYSDSYFFSESTHIITISALKTYFHHRESFRATVFVSVTN